LTPIMKTMPSCGPAPTSQSCMQVQFFYKMLYTSTQIHEKTTVTRKHFHQYELYHSQKFCCFRFYYHLDVKEHNEQKC